MKWLSFFLMLMSSFAIADECKMPSRLQTDLLLNDVVGYLAGDISVTRKVMLELSHNNFTEYTYSNNEYSKAILEISNNIDLLGEGYIKSLKSVVSNEEKESAAKKHFEKISDSCNKEQLIILLSESIKSSLSGKNKRFEYELLQVNLKAISKMYIY
ncbi:hypothetical protein A1OW_15840 [Enterovibrio norvegicus]|uniref:hypothetical protein n=1 Tax=Enterovibrio norvegicus TaxID=188144 RepID=UPI000365B77B|nr:hypothetical protein [Enterovibrio norvegicus]OEF48247.1 hypothetical protein A1OW_15840 [Enterovibrio norvegicus]